MMPNTRTILIVDDDPELRDALTEQLSLHEEFEAIAVENGSKAVQAAKAGQIAAAGAKPLTQNAYKVKLVEVAVKRALLTAAGAKKYWEV